MPSDIDYLTNLPPEQQRIRDTCYHPTGTFIPIPKEAIEQSIPARFEEMVRRYPDRLAVKAHNHAATYAEMNDMANRIAYVILAQCREEQVPIAVLLGQGVPFVASILGVLKAGKCYVPMDPALPEGRLKAMVEDSQAGTIVTDDRHFHQARDMATNRQYVLNLDRLTSDGPAENPVVSVSPNDLMAIFYTSGSTGQPKGVMRTHRHMLHSTTNTTNTLRVCAADRITCLRSSSSTGTPADLFPAILNGGALQFFDPNTQGLANLGGWLMQEGITIYRSVPTLFRHFVRTLTEGMPFPSLRIISLGGDTVYRDDVTLYQQHFSPNCIMYSAFSISEAGPVGGYFIDKATQMTTPAVPAGYPVGYNEVLLFDEDGREVGVNQIGEIAVRGRYLNPGYWHKPDLTQAKFQPDPNRGDHRICLTGDLGRIAPDGCLTHLGRKDFQVKIRGNRVEVAEIEAVLQTLDVVKDVVVVAQAGQTGAQRLVTYVVPEPNAVPSVTLIRRTLAEALPAYMMPSAFVILDALPLLPSGKLDRRSLPLPDRARPPLDVLYRAPRTPVETELTQLWAEVLDLDQVGIDDPFLDLGGHSLFAMQLLARVIKTFQVDLPIRTLLEAPTVAEMALVITQNQAAKADPDTIDRLLAEVEAMADD